MKIAIDHELQLGKIDEKECDIPRGLMARIPGSHPGGPGSISGVGDYTFGVFCYFPQTLRTFLAFL